MPKTGSGVHEPSPPRSRTCTARGRPGRSRGRSPRARARARPWRWWWRAPPSRRSRRRRAAQDVVLHPEVVGHDAEAPLVLTQSPRAASRIGTGTRWPSAPSAWDRAPRLRARGHRAAQVEPDHRARARAFATSASGRDRAPMTPRLAPCVRRWRVERARVDLADAHDARLVQVAARARPTRATTTRGCDTSRTTKPGHLRTRRLDVLAVDAVVADVGVRHRDDLAGVGGIGQHLLVAAERGVEHHLARRLAAVGRTPAPRTPVPSSRASTARARTDAISISHLRAHARTPSGTVALRVTRVLSLSENGPCRDGRIRQAQWIGPALARAARSGRTPCRRCTSRAPRPRLRLSLLLLRWSPSTK